MKASAVLQAALVFLIIIVPGFANAESVDDVKIYAAGDPVYVNGNAPGAQSAGLAAWIFGLNYWSEESFDTESDGSYTYEIDGGVTESLSSGQYYVIIQHPMYNGVFDATLQTGSPGGGQTSVVSSGGGSFIIEGQGKLQGSAAAYALMNMLDSQNIDDTYSVTTFYLEEPWIRTDDVEVYPAGSVIRLKGTSNIAAGERLIYTFYPASGDIPSSKQSEGTAYTPQMAGQVYIDYGKPSNLWAADINTEGMDPGTYIFTIESVEAGNAVQKYITLYEPVRTSASPEETLLPEITASAATTSAAETAAASGETPQAGVSPVSALAASLIAAVTAVRGLIPRRG